MVQTTCSIEDCDRKTFGRGWCEKHYRRWYRHGDPEYVTVIRDDDEARFWSKIDVGDCWEWTGSRNEQGYGHFAFRGRNVSTHRWAYETMVGPIPEGLELDHLCRNRRCVNPDHLEPVTHRENSLRGYAGPGLNARKTHCIRGHYLNESNTYVRPDGRRCRACIRMLNQGGGAVDIAS